MSRRLVGAGLVVGALLLGSGASQVAAQPDDAAGGAVTLTIGLLQDLSSPNVTVGFLVSDFELWNLQYASLTDKAADDFETVPGLAESWEGSDDGLTYTYTLREDLQWSDGEPLTAADVAYTINRGRDEEWANHFSTVGNLDAVAIDDRTVEITSSVPDPRLPTMDVYVVPEHVYSEISADDLASYDGLDGVASGQYSLTEWRSGQDWTMTKNPNWFGSDNGIDRIVFRVFTNGDAMVAALQAGEIDAAHEVPRSALERLESDPDIEVVSGEQGTFTQLAMNGGAGGIGDGHPALQDLEVRHAIAHAIDRDVLFERVALGTGSVGTVMVPSADPVWTPELSDDEAFEFDPELANAKLDDAGYLDTDGDGVREMPDGGEPLRFRYVERSESEPAAAIREFVTQWLADIGIATEIEVMDDGQLYEASIAGEYDLFVWGWTPFVDPDPQLSYFTCDQLTTDVDDPGNNDANWCDPVYDELYERQRVELDRDARIEIVHEMVKFFHENATYVVLLQDADPQAYRTDRFEGWLRQPAEVGPVLFSNSSPTYANLTAVEGGDSDGGGIGTVGIVAIVVAAVAILGGGLLLVRRSRATADDRE
ncbi:MAG TPA: ABC transporter substrate-binding protein [Ilumatobacteraceae bacterium]|nr:ABC transporter substrate-binding protein [Ilumatobacteraceae bacterium]